MKNIWTSPRSMTLADIGSIHYSTHLKALLWLFMPCRRVLLQRMSVDYGDHNWRLSAHLLTD